MLEGSRFRSQDVSQSIIDADEISDDVSTHNRMRLKLILKNPLCASRLLRLFGLGAIRRHMTECQAPFPVELRVLSMGEG
jgi:hypothetical protein